MQWPAQIVWVRHGESQGNIRCQDAMTNKPNHAYSLTDKGQTQAKATGQYLQQQFGEFDQYYVSTYTRARQTLALMYPECEPWVDSRINELSRGVWRDLPETTVFERFPEEAHIKERAGRYQHRPLGGQSSADVELAIHCFLQDLRLNHSGERVLVCTHGRFLMLLRRVIENLRPEDLDDQVPQCHYKNCSISITQPHGKRLVYTTDNHVAYAT